MITFRVPLALLLPLFAFSNLARASQVFVQFATGTGVSASDLETTTQLVQTAVSEVSADTVTNDALKADYQLAPKLIRLGGSYILNLSKLKDGKVVYSSQLKAAQMDELDKVSTRLTRSVINGERAASNPRVGEITDQEAKEGTQRRP